MTRMPGFTADVALFRSRESYPGRRLPSDLATSNRVGVVPSIYIETHPQGTTGLYGEIGGGGDFGGGGGFFGGGGGGGDLESCLAACSAALYWCVQIPGAFFECEAAYAACCGVCYALN
jgi:hypothetical protein